ncbi:hypothetical protein BOX15_Mlig010665g2 [Macrostomum lignano]|uniref:Phosphatidylinositol-glycan biosynthesis class W protein n=2 Tax=Macrostomum lignano TaxID=282301 RepID=A0A267DBW2_9PLAT|nr:hypothetical protein BOX15_Mlig010665g2 [Macrostomum lignano]
MVSMATLTNISSSPSNHGDKATRKAAHEAFVSGHGGCSLVEIWLHLTLPCLLLALTAQLRCCCHGNSRLLRLIGWLEAGLLCCSAVLQLTVLADHVTELVCAAAACLLLLLPFAQRNNFDFVVEPPQPRPLFKEFQALLLLQTSVAILAVDFPAMPRRLAKAESAGVGLMDVGAPAFAFASGLLAPAPTPFSMSRWRRSLVGACLPLALLGLARTLAVKASDYQEHVTEYGVHWNFFITLACLRAVWPALSGRPGLWSLVLAAGHCLLVLPFGGAEFLLASGDRHLLWPLVANKEGLMSLPPYCAIYCAGAAIGRRLRVGTESTAADANRLISWPLLLLAIVALPWALTVASVKLPPIVTEPSRLLFNAGFLITCLAACCQVLLMLTIGRLLCLGSIDRSCSPVLALIGRCSLAYFLLANLLTGAVNLTVDTVAISDKLVAMGILIVYLICLVGSLPLLSMVIGAWQQRGLAGSRSKAE